ncbi:hypothetical protein ACXC9Q_08785 [Kribbella sp. CWNU-51]
MSWQLWVLIALAATGLVLLAVARMRHARHVFDDITRLGGPTDGSQPGAGRPPGLAGLTGFGGRPGFAGRIGLAARHGLTGDELAQARARRLEPGDEQAHGTRRKHG